MRARRAGTAAARMRRTVVGTDAWRADGGPARLGTVVSCLTARAARPGAQRRDTPESALRALSMRQRRKRRLDDRAGALFAFGPSGRAYEARVKTMLYSSGALRRGLRRVT